MLYESQCARCHGDRGHGDGKEARRLGFYARDFALGSFKCRCTPSGELPTDEDLLRTLTRGMPGTPMTKPPDVHWTREDELAVIQYIKSFSTKFVAQTAAACISIPPRPADAGNAANEGRQIYRVLRCWNCHGVRGRGDGPGAARLKDDWDRPIKYFNFTFLRFKCGNEDQDLYRTLHTGMNGTPMPSYREGFLFAGERDMERHPFLELFGAKDTDAISAYLETQPDAAALEAMSDEEKETLIAHRTWALIDYLRSLLRASGKR